MPTDCQYSGYGHWHWHCSRSCVHISHHLYTKLGIKSWNRWARWPQLPPQDANTMCADLCCMLLLWYIDITLRSPSVLILSYRTVRGWNRLPQGTVQISTPEAFKSAFLRFIQRRRWCSYAKYVLSRLTSCWLDRFYENETIVVYISGRNCFTRTAPRLLGLQNHRG